MDFKKLLTRALSGLVYCLIIVGCILFGGVEGTLILALLLGALATLELSKISHELTRAKIPTIILDVTGVMCLCAGSYFYPLIIWVAIWMCRMIEELYLHAERPLRNLAFSALPQLYIGVPMLMMTAIAAWTHPNAILLLFFLIWINDTGAYLVGCTLGRHRLFERISPKKSWEGFFGGLAFTLAASAIFYGCCPGFFGLLRIMPGIAGWLGLGLIVTIFGTWGDLIESMIKRTLKIKDSGKMIPGHGGILDRIDSLLLVLPAAAIYLFFYLICSSYGF